MEKAGILLVNKPSGITSHDLVMKIRRKLNTQKVGHTGTLDPLASGVMMLTVGKATKILPYIVEHDKEYVAELKLGIRTDTSDITGNIVEQRDVVPVSEEEIRQAMSEMTGEQKQIPPMYSAKKINGRKLYELAREDIVIERDPVDINIYELKLLDFNGNDEIRFRIRCSSGTYVRTVCEDLSRKLGNVGTMKSLVRTAIDRYTLNDCYELENIDDSVTFLSTYEILSGYPYVEIEDLKPIYDGKKIQIDCNEDLIFIVNGGRIIAAYERITDNGIYASKRGLW